VTATDRNFGMMYQTESDGISFPVANFGGNAINTTAENYVNDGYKISYRASKDCK
jgi:hypothetical protein